MIKINYKIAAIVVTYNRKDKLLRNIKCLLEQSRKLDKIYIIDNASTDNTEEYIKDIVLSNNIEYIRLDDNIGGSGGFYTGIKQAFDDNYDYIWGMDDDAFPDKNALYELEQASFKISDKNACLCSNCDDDAFVEVYKEVESWMFVGFYIPKYVIQKVGLPRNDFFIYHDDSEYAYRIRKCGYKIYKVRDAVIEHGNFSSRDSYCKEVFKKKIIFPKMSDWKLYYFVRNAILMYKCNDINKYKQIFINLPKVFIKLLILNRSQLSVFIKAYVHGILGVRGIRMKP